MDRTLNLNKRTNKRRMNRNEKAWQLLSPNGTDCPFCGHPRQAHMMSSGQPHFYRPATPKEQSSARGKLYRHKRPGKDVIMVKRVLVGKEAEIITAFCGTCAKEKNTDQVLCYHRTLAVGEVVGIRDEPD